MKRAMASATASASWGKYFLALLNLYEYEGLNAVLPEPWLLPEALPIHPSRLWCHCRAVYLPLDPSYDLRPDALEGFGDCDVVCIDDVERIAGNAAWERALFVLFEAIRQGGGRLVIAAERGPLHNHFVLPDLISRFTSGATFRIKPLSDDDKLRALQLRASWRGLELGDEVARFIIARVERSPARLFGLLDQLDREALTAQKKLTVPFVRSVLEKISGSSTQTHPGPTHKID